MFQTLAGYFTHKMCQLRQMFTSCKPIIRNQGWKVKKIMPLWKALGTVCQYMWIYQIHFCCVPVEMTQKWQVR